MVIASFDQTEAMLHDVLRVVPYCPEHENVWSPQLVTILLDTCSQLDSLWKSQSATGSRPDITDYFQMFGGEVAKRWLVVWGEEGQRLQPFAEWDGVPGYTRAAYTPLPWWKAYNDVKHDRLANRKEATLGRTVFALAALLVAIVRCPDCAEGVAQAEWVPEMKASGFPPREFLAGGRFTNNTVAETKLFSYPISSGTGWSLGVVRPRTSTRFLHWMDENGIQEW
jgi:hypothetical protein